MQPEWTKTLNKHTQSSSGWGYSESHSPHTTFSGYLFQVLRVALPSSGTHVLSDPQITAPCPVARCPGFHFQRSKQGLFFLLKMARTEQMALLNAVVQWLQHIHRRVNVLVQFLNLKLFNQQLMVTQGGRVTQWVGGDTLVVISGIYS